eukprot:COSAG01_NODE_2478_length_7613_cov_477.283737_1_plen_220_part_00
MAAPAEPALLPAEQPPAEVVLGMRSGATSSRVAEGRRRRRQADESDELFFRAAVAGWERGSSGEHFPSAGSQLPALPPEARRRRPGSRAAEAPARGLVRQLWRAGPTSQVAPRWPEDRIPARGDVWLEDDLGAGLGAGPGGGLLSQSVLDVQGSGWEQGLQSGEGTDASSTRPGLLDQRGALKTEGGRALGGGLWPPPGWLVGGGGRRLRATRWSRSLP